MAEYSNEAYYDESGNVINSYDQMNTQQQYSEYGQENAMYDQTNEYVQEYGNSDYTNHQNSNPNNLPNVNTHTDQSQSSQPQSARSQMQQPPQSTSHRRMIRPHEMKEQTREVLPEANTKIDEESVPRVRITNEVQEYIAEPKVDTLPPPIRGPYIAFDNGNATPRYVRMTLYNMPSSSDTAEKCHLAISAVVQPLANPGIGEEEIPLVNMGDDGPMRCQGCRGYLNPHVSWTSMGSKWQCNLCGISNDVPVNYRCTLDGSGQRRDKMERFELHKGSVDYIPPLKLANDWKRRPTFFFVIDVSPWSYHRGLIESTINGIRNGLSEYREMYKNNESNENNNNNKLHVGFLTYDDKIHFHGLSDNGLYVISGVDDPFVALPDIEIIIPLFDDSKYEKWDKLLERIYKLFENNYNLSEDNSKNCLGSAIAAGCEVLNKTGGKIFVIQSSLPTIGIGKLLFRESMDVYGTIKERELYLPQNEFYQELSNKCSENFISIDLFACSSGYLDIASVGELSRRTNGQIYYYANFTNNKDGLNLENEIKQDILRQTYFKSVMAIRASKGLEIADYLGNFLLTEDQEIQLPIITSDSTISVRMQHYEKLENNIAYLQIALLYLTINMDVFIRVHTIGIPIVKRIADVFRCVDIDTVINVSLKQCATELCSPISNKLTIAQARDQLTKACIDILYTYRRWCAQTSAMRQLVLPEALKLLPLFTLGMMKNPILFDDITADERCYHICYILTMPIYESITYIHPFLYPLHTIFNHSNNSSILTLNTQTQRLLYPQCLNLTEKSLKNHGLYLLNNGRSLYICYGEQLNQQIKIQCFKQYEQESYDHEGRIVKHKGIILNDDYLNNENENENENHMGYRLQLFIDELRFDKPIYLPIQIFSIPNENKLLNLDQKVFLSNLIEDPARIRTSNNATTNTNTQNPVKMGYVDFLVYIHKQIQQKMMD